MDQRQKKVYRGWLCICIVFFVAFMAGLYYWRVQSIIPERVTLYQHQTEHLDFSIPFAQVSITQGEKLDSKAITYSMDQKIAVQTGDTGSFQGDVKLFGLIHCKYIQFDVTQQARVMPVGCAVGLYINSDGVMVLGTGQVETSHGNKTSPAKGKLQTGDYIEKVNHRQVDNIQDIVQQIQDSQGASVVVQVRRDNRRLQIKLQPVLSPEKTYQIGVWLREDTEGIGTLTFVTEKNQFAALGHGITDADTGQLISLKDGGLYPATVEGIIPGERNQPGEIRGSVQLGSDNQLGVIQNNTSLGITGDMIGNAYLYNSVNSLLLGRKQDVKKESAYILCQLGDQVEKYQIHIESVDVSSDDNKGMEIQVTDSKLLRKTGGIIQGMSGAPIIQNGKLIGAVTHVFVKDATRGYATFVETCSLL